MEWKKLDQYRIVTISLSITCILYSSQRGLRSAYFTAVNHIIMATTHKPLQKETNKMINLPITADTM